MSLHWDFSQVKDPKSPISFQGISVASLDSPSRKSVIHSCHHNI